MHIRPKGQFLRRADAGEFLAFVIAYCDLLTARWQARDRRVPARATRVPLSHLRGKGVPDHLLLWMIFQAHVVHSQAAANDAKGGDDGASTGSLLLTASSSFSLTDLGELFASRFLDDVLASFEEAILEAAWDMLIVGRLTPWYDKDDRVFWWGRHVLKCFRQPSPNQELVLSAAEELQWTSWFDDPLPKRAGKSPKIRLHDTIKDLNRRQAPHLIHFKGDGTGSRIGWEYH
jgi:hypothetical protein